jgi:hypothetical protein
MNQNPDLVFPAAHAQARRLIFMERMEMRTTARFREKGNRFISIHLLFVGRV